MITYKKLNVLVACEESQTVCLAFRELGHNAYSCDIQDCSGGHPEWHIKDDAIKVAYDKSYNWDLMIAHPPCNDLAVSGASHFKIKKENGKQQKSIDFFMKFVDVDIPKKAIENPIGIMSTIYRKPNQIIQPFWFGDTAQKSTCLWLFNLPNLIPTNIVEKGEFVELIDKKTGKTKKQAKWYFDALKDKNNRAKIRSKTFIGIAKAMAEQWGK